MRVSGSVALVTGASSGIGRATALAFAREGATVVVTARRSDLLDGLAREIRRRGGQALPLPCDVSVFEQVQRLRGQVEGSLGRVDILVNNAGVPGGGAFAELSMDQIERVVRVNYLGVLHCTKVFLPVLLSRGQGHIVNVASLAGRFAVPGSSIYSSTKHAVVAFSEALHFEVAPKGVRVTTVNPGLVETEGFPQTKARRVGMPVMEPEEIARLIVRVVATGKAPEISRPRWLASLQVVRLFAPGLYRFALARLGRGGAISTPAPPRA